MGHQVAGDTLGGFQLPGADVQEGARVLDAKHTVRELLAQRQRHSLDQRRFLCGQVVRHPQALVGSQRQYINEHRLRSTRLAAQGDCAAHDGVIAAQQPTQVGRGDLGVAQLQMRGEPEQPCVVAVRPQRHGPVKRSGGTAHVLCLGHLPAVQVERVVHVDEAARHQGSRGWRVRVFQHGVDIAGHRVE
jgi:hypothetical protein